MKSTKDVHDKGAAAELEKANTLNTDHKVAPETLTRADADHAAMPKNMQDFMKTVPEPHRNSVKGSRGKND